MRKCAGRQASARREPDDRKRSIGCVVPFAVRLGGSQAARQGGIARLRGETTVFERAEGGEQPRDARIDVRESVAADGVGIAEEDPLTDEPVLGNDDRPVREILVDL